MNKIRLIILFVLTGISLNCFSAAAPGGPVIIEPLLGKKTLMSYLSDWVSLWAYVPKDYRHKIEHIKNLEIILNKRDQLNPVFDRIGLPNEWRDTFISLLLFKEPGVLEIFGKNGDKLLDYLQKFISLIIKSVPNRLDSHSHLLSEIGENIQDAESFPKQFRASYLQRLLAKPENKEVFEGIALHRNPLIDWAEIERAEKEIQIFPAGNLDLFTRIIEFGVNNGFTFEENDFLPKLNILIAAVGVGLTKEQADKIVANLPHLINTKDEDGLTPLMFAIFHNDYNLAQALIEAGADLNLQVPEVGGDEDGFTALHIAVDKDSFLIVRLLLKGGVDTTIQDKKGRIAADLAKRPEVKHLIQDYELHGRLEERMSQAEGLKETELPKEVAELVLGYLGEKEDINAYGRDGATPLMRAVAAEDIARVKALIQAGANLNTKGLNFPGFPGDVEDTALHIAVTQGRLPLVQVLIDAGADPLIKNNWGETPLEHARKIYARYEKLGNVDRPDRGPIINALEDYIVKRRKLISKALKPLPQSAEELVRSYGVE